MAVGLGFVPRYNCPSSGRQYKTLVHAKQNCIFLASILRQNLQNYKSFPVH